MPQKLTSAIDLFKPSQKAVMRNANAFGVLVVLPTILIIAADIASGSNNGVAPTAFATPTDTGIGGLFRIIGIILSLAFLPAGYYLEIQAAKGKTISTGEALRQSAPYFWRVYGLIVVTALIIIGGLIAFIVPGLIFIHRYFLAPYFMVSQNIGIKESLRASALAVKGRNDAVWPIIGLTILLALLNIIPLVGVFVAAAFLTLYSCAPALRYLELKKLSKNAAVKS